MSRSLRLSAPMGRVLLGVTFFSFSVLVGAQSCMPFPECSIPHRLPPLTLKFGTSAEFPFVGATVTLTATVIRNHPNAALPTSVTFYDGDQVLGVRPMTLGSPAVLQVSFATAGVHSVSAVCAPVFCKGLLTEEVQDSPSPPPPGGDVLSNPTLQLSSAKNGVPVTGVIATFTDSNPSAIVSDFTAMINWGDGTESAGVVSGSAGTLNVSASPEGHTYSERGSFTVSVSLSAPGVTSSVATGTVSVRHHR